MSEAPKQLSGPDLSQGVGLASLADGTMLLGHVAGEPVLLAKRGSDIFAISAACTHYSGPLAQGLIVDETVRCPWHHACFSLRTGEALRAPALNPVACWRVEQQADTIFVREKLRKSEPKKRPAAAGIPRSVVIIGGGGAGNAAAEMLRREGFGGRITMLSADNALPYDRPNLSKDYLAGTAPEDWIPLRSAEFYKEKDINVKLDARVVSIDTAGRTVFLANGDPHGFEALLLSTGVRPIRLGIPGADRSEVYYLRSFDDSRALITKAQDAHRAVVIGASFIGLEVAAALRARGLDVHVLGPRSRPLERVLGPELGDMVQKIHEERGVVFHLGTTATQIDDNGVTLENGARLAADLIAVGIGVRPELELAVQSGLAVDKGIVVDEYLETSVPGIFSAGDIARWPDRLSGESIRVEHWVVAERQGQTAARNILGQKEPFRAVPFFWSQHYDLAISYVGHAEHWDRVDIDGRPAARDCAVTYWRGGRKLAVATVSRDLDSLRAEIEFERSFACS